MISSCPGSVIEPSGWTWQPDLFYSFWPRQVVYWAPMLVFNTRCPRMRHLYAEEVPIAGSAVSMESVGGSPRLSQSLRRHERRRDQADASRGTVGVSGVRAGVRESAFTSAFTEASTSAAPLRKSARIAMTGRLDYLAKVRAPATAVGPAR